MPVTKWARAVSAASALALTVGWTVTEADAGGYAVREQSTYYQGMSFAGNAAGGTSPSSMFWNPATITQHPGRTVEANAALLIGRSTIDVDQALSPLGMGPLTGGDSGELAHPALIPATYTVLQITDSIFFGSTINAPFGLAFEADDDWAGRFHGVRSELRTLDWNPTVAYRFNDYFSVGLGAQIVYAKAKLTGATLLPAPFPVGTEGDSELKGHDFGYGFTAGVTVSPTDRTTIGLGFRSAVDLELEGDVRLRTQTDTEVARFDVDADVTFPEVVTLSVTHMLTDRIKVAGSVEWTNWSRFDELRVKRSADGATVQLVTENWDDGWFFALGGEYQATDRFAVRGGVAYEISPIPDAFRTPRIPDADRIWLSAGVLFQATERLSLDLSYTHIFVEDGPINRANANEVGLGGAPDNALLQGEATDQAVDIISFAAKYKFGGDPIFAGRL